MPTERRRRPPREETRRALLDAAGRVFAERGYSGASVEAVSKAAGLSTGALYSNFSGKEDLFLSLYEERVERRRRELTDAATAGESGPEALSFATATVDRSLDADLDFFLLYFEFALHAARNPGFRRRFEEIRSEGLAKLAFGLTRGLEHVGAEDSAVSAEELAQAMRALGYGLALDRIINGEPIPSGLVGRILALVFAGIRAEGAAAKTDARDSQSSASA